MFKFLANLFHRRCEQEDDIYKSLVNGIQGCAIYMLNPGGIIKTWNKGAEIIIGWTSEEIIGQHFSLLFSPEDVSKGKPNKELQTAMQEGSFETEEWRLHKNGSRFLAHVVVTPLYKNSVHVGFTKIVRDLTQKQRVLTLEERDRQRSKFLAMLAHELRNPLAPVRTNLHIIEEKYGYSLDDSFIKLMSVAKRQVDHMIQLVDDLLDAARVANGKIDLKMQLVRVSKSIEGALTVLESQGKINQCQIKVDCPKDVIVEADPMRLEQILINLLDNSIRCTKGGEEIHIYIEQEEDWVHIIIRDHGCGIRSEDLPYIFDLFYQGDRSIERSEGGLGIGLTIVKQLMDLHGGIIKVDTSLDKGTSFDLRFRRMTTKGRQINNSKTGKRILIVEDNKDAAHSLSMLFGLDNHEIMVCHDGNSAVIQASVFDPDFVILDIGLPGLSGFDVAKALRRSTITESTKIIAVSGYTAQDDFKQAKSAGIDEYFPKPADPEKLRRLILDTA